MQRRNTRLRREYLYRKSLEGKEREIYEKRRKIREALQVNGCILLECSRALYRPPPFFLRVRLDFRYIMCIVR